MMEDSQTKAYEAFSKAARSNTALDAKTTVLVCMAASMAIGCYP